MSLKVSFEKGIVRKLRRPPVEAPTPVSIAEPFSAKEAKSIALFVLERSGMSALQMSSQSSVVTLLTLPGAGSPVRFARLRNAVNAYSRSNV
jgi:hypothetical protein